MPRSYLALTLSVLLVSFLRVDRVRAQPPREPTDPAGAPVAPPPPSPEPPPLEPAPPPPEPSPAVSGAEPTPPEPPSDRLDPKKARFDPGKGVSFQSEDKTFALAMRLRAQFLYTVLDESGEDLTHLLQIRRARLQFLGHVFSKHYKYKAEFAFSPRDQGVRDDVGPTVTPLLDWYVELDHLQDANLRVGQYKVPFNRQRVISSGDLQLVDRALAQGEFNLDRDVGLHVFSPDIGKLGYLRYYAGAWMNQGRDARNFTGYDMMYMARVEVLPFGMFADYKEADLERRTEPGLSIGVAYAFLDDALRDRGILGSVPDDEGTTDIHALAADVLFKLKGLSIFGELYYRTGDRNPGAAVDEMGNPIPASPTRDGFGWFLQAGYLLPQQPIEVAARYSEVRPVGDDSALTDEHELGAGVSWYRGGHSLKLQADYFRGWGNDFSEGSNQVRVQLQVAY